MGPLANRVAEQPGAPRGRGVAEKVPQPLLAGGYGFLRATRRGDRGAGSVVALRRRPGRRGGPRGGTGVAVFRRRAEAAVGDGDHPVALPSAGGDTAVTRA